MYGTKIYMIRFNSMCQSILTLKELIKEGDVFKPEIVTQVRNNKIDLFSKFIGLDKFPLDNDFIYL